MKLTQNQLDVLMMLSDRGWERPMDIGGRCYSNESAILNQLVRKGLVEHWRRNPSGSRPSYKYRRLPAGRAVIEAKREAR